MVLEGIRVVELADGFAGPFCGLMFADSGAEVVKIESPEGDRTRSIGPFNNGVSQVFLSLNRGKKSVVLNLKSAEGREAAMKLMESADVVITHFPPGLAKTLGLDYDTVKATNPDLIYCSISDFGSHGPFRNQRGSELSAQALSGIWRYLGDMSTKEARAALIEPLRVGTYIGSTWAGHFLFHGAVSALLARKKLGGGQLVETSLLGSIAAVQSQNWAAHTKPDKWYGFELIGPMAIPDQGVPTKDGRVNPFVLVAPPNQTREFFKSLGFDRDDPRFRYTFTALAPRVAEDRPNLQLLSQVFEKLTTDDACKTMHQLDVLCAPIFSYTECVAHPQTKHIGTVIDVDHPKGGQFKTIRFPLRLTLTPAKSAGRPPLLGENTEEVLSKQGFGNEDIRKINSARHEFDNAKIAFEEEASTPAGSSPDGPGPLHGLKVIDFGGFAVGPWAASLLGLLGADVIKVDPPHGDGITGREPTQNGVNIAYTTFNQGKAQIVALDLKKPDDVEIGKQLVREADVLIENMRPGVMDRLGFGHEACLALNPNLIYVSASGYGETGPISDWGSADDFAQSFTGYAALNGVLGDLPQLVRFRSTCDLSTSMTMVSGALLGLFARQSQGKGQWIRTSMLEASMFIQTSRYAEFFATGSNPPRMASKLPNVVPDQAFRTNDAYIAVSATSQEEWKSLCSAMDLASLATDPRYATNEDRVKNREELIAKLEEKFQKLPSWWWFSHLSKNNVPCGLYLTLEDVMQHEHFRKNNFLVEIDIPIAGKVVFAGPPVQFSKTPSKIVTPAIGVINPRDLYGSRWKLYGPVDRYPNGYPGEHTELIKERFRNKQPLFLTT